MTEPEELEDDLFADLYDGDDTQPKNEEPAAQPDPTPVAPIPIEPSVVNSDMQQESSISNKDEDIYGAGQNGEISSGWNGTIANDEQSNQFSNGPVSEEEPPRIGIKEDGKMFIGGLNWETTDQSLKEYFSQFGEVQECTVMRDGASGRSRGFGFLTFKNPRDVNAVMVKEHYLDGKIIDPKRAIPRDEQERTSKIFVGGVSQDATEAIFKEYFAQYGRVVDATLMMDKDTGRPRGFGFVTFDSESAVDNTLNGDLTILGKPIEVKKAQPRGNMREDEDVSLGRGGPGGGRNMRGGRNNNFNDRDNANNNNNNNSSSIQNNGNQMGGMAGGMTPQMMAQYWAKMQQYFATMQQQMAMGQMGGMQAMGGMNPAMMQQMQQMQQMKAMQMAQQQAVQQQQQQNRGSASPMPDTVQSPGEGVGNQHGGGGMMPGMQGMNPAMMAQMGMNPVMMAQMQAQMQQQGGGPGGMSPAPPNQGGAGGHHGTPGYNAQDQILFEQQKYEQQQARRAAQEAGMAGGGGGGGVGGPTSWEGMYEDVPPPGGGSGGNQGGFGRGRGGYGFRGGGGGGGDGVGHRGSGSQTPQSAAPANAPTGPKNAGKPGANYRGGGHRGGHRGFHPYQR